jgi:hypothetical protein
MNRSKLVLPVAIGLLGSIVGIAAALPNPYTRNPTDDEMIFGTSGSADTGNASGAGPGLFAGADGSLNIKRSLVLFDPSALGSVTVTTAHLDLWIGQIAGTGGGGGGGGGCGMNCTYPTRNFAIYPSTTAWHEGHVGNTACSGSPCSSMGGTGQGWSYTTCSPSSSSPCLHDATWQYYDWTGTVNTDEWTHATTDQDYGYGSQGTAMATVTVSAPFMVGDLVEFTGTTTTNPNFRTTAQNWAAGTGNLGLELRSTNLEGSQASFLGFWSKDGAAAASNGLSPVLSIAY